jgi:hypothetical protein
VGRNTETLTRQRKQLSNIRVKDLKGNWTHDKQKVPKKSQIDYSAGTHKYQKTKHKKLIQHLHILEGMSCYYGFFTVTGRGETGKRTDRALKDNGIAQHPK